jgi:glyoxylase-like metal-dependent hydrolase (beta-lactamase superfamily II)
MSIRSTLAAFTLLVTVVVSFGSAESIAVSFGADQSVGETLSPFSPGSLDIHHINTGQGNAAFLVLPDGTTLLIDCGFGQAARPPRYKAPRRPDESRLPPEWVARYIKRVHPGGSDAAIDYAVVSHFHDDHMGGIADLLRTVRVRSLLDRGWPDYGAPLPFDGPRADLYTRALEEQVDRHGMQVARFKAGAADQIVLLHAAQRYRDFEVRNLAVNGEAWTGEGTAVRARAGGNEKYDENTYSAALRLRYGRFDYYTGGDLPGSPAEAGPLARDMESAIAWVTGPVDVAVLDHHGNSDGSNAFFLSVLRPRVSIANVWAARQVDPETLARLRSERIYPGPRDIFATNGMWDGRADHIKQVFGESAGLQHLENLKSLAADQGHIVVRVAPGGMSYRVFVLVDSDETMRIKSIHGPYSSQ